MIPQGALRPMTAPELKMPILVGVMEPIAINPIIPAALSALSPFQPAQTSVIQVSQTGKASGSAAASAQTLAQHLFHQALQSAALYPVSEPAAGSGGLTQDIATSLLSALAPPQAPAASAPSTEATANPAAPQAQAAPSSAPSATDLSPPSLADLPAGQDAFGTSLSPDFAMETALRFGAGVVAEAATPGTSSTVQGTGLVRDATAVLRLENLQPRAGGPGPEAFTQPGPPAQRVLRTYDTGSTIPATQGTGTVDLLA